MDQVTACREYEGPVMGCIMSYLNNVYVDTPEGKSLTSMKDKQDGPLG